MKRLTRFLACFLAAVLVVSNLQYVGVKAVEVEEITVGAEGAEASEEVADVDSYTYTFKQLTYDSKGPSVTVSENGSASIAAASNYASVFITIPEEVAGREIQKVTFNVTSDNAGNFAYKAFMAEGFADAMWGDGITVTEENKYAIYGNPVQAIPADFQNGLGYLAVMSCFNGDLTEDTIEISGITFDCTPIKPIDKTYSFGELTYDSKGPSVTVSENGSASITATSNYASVFITIPEEVAAGDIEKVTFNVTSDNAGNFAYKAFMAEGFADAMWGDGITVTEENKYAIYGNPVQVIPADYQSGLGYLAVMSCFNGDLTEDTIEISGITFTYKKSSGNKPVITYGDNIIKNPNFAEEDLSAWNMGVSNAKIKAAAAEEAIFDDVKTYGVIDRDAAYVSEDGKQDARHEFFAQDITEAIKAGGDLNRKPEYKVEFWAKLSEDYKDAPADQRVVEFAPYIVTEQDGEVYLGVSYSSQLGGDLRKELTVGEWTKYSGTFNVTHDGTIKKVVIRVVEQGTEYGDIEKGACVKGDFYVTGFSMTEVFKPETTIEKDIPNWKDAITSAFGDDAIAGTCLGSGTITFEHFQELAKKHFNAITFENEMKPDITLGSTPKFDENGELIYNFAVADRMMAQIKEWNDLDANDNINFKIRGHVLVWHSQTPEWFFHEDYDTSKDFVTPEVMNVRLEKYIAAVFNHYNSVKFEDGTTAADMFYGWDIVNEAMSDNTGKPRKASDSSNWARVYGDESNEYIVNAFRYANKYAPKNIKLYYNDYNDSNEPKASGIAALVAEITSHEKDAENPTRIDGVGMQAHHNFLDPTAGQIKSAINKYLTALGEGGVVEMTEFDVKRSSSYDGTAATLKTEYAKQAWRFKEIFDVYREVEKEKPGAIGGITMWGVTDDRSWLQSQGTVGGGSTGGAHAPLLFAVENYVAKAKPAFYAFFDEYVDTLEPMIQNVTFMQQLEKDNFDNAISYDIAGVASFVPVWTKDGLVMKVVVNDDTDNKEKDTITVYVDEAGSKADGDFKKVTVARNAEGVKSTAKGYEAIINIPMGTASAKTFSMDIAVDNNGVVSVFNDKKATQATSSKNYAEAIMKPYATIGSGSAVIDAKEDAIWTTVDAIPLTIKLGANADAKVKAVWDKEYLYVYADIKDAVLDATSTQAHEVDSLEVFIDENNAKADSYEDDDKQYRISYENVQTFNGPQCTEENVESATKVIEGYGYIVEAKYKWTHIKPAAGNKIGIEFQINDAEGGTRIGTASWYDTSGNGWSSPSVFGTVALVGDGGAAEDSAAADAAAVKSVTDKIKAIGTVKYDAASKAKIDEARKAYDALTPAQKAQIPADVLKVLTSAESTYKEAEAEAGKGKGETPKVEYFAKFSVKSVPLKVKQSSTALAKDIQIAKGDKVVSWKSSNSKVVSVTKTGKIKGKKVGKAKITATTQSGKTATITVKVQKKAVAAKKVTLTNKATNKAIKAKSTVTLKKGKKMTVVANVAPMTCAQKVKFTSSNKKVVSVTSKGVIKAKKKGTATITAKVGKKSFKFKVKVK